MVLEEERRFATNQAVQIVVAVEKIQPFGCVPGKALCLGQAFLGRERIGQSDHAVVDADVVPEITYFGQVVQVVRCVLPNWNRFVVSQFGLLRSAEI